MQWRPRENPPRGFLEPPPFLQLFGFLFVATVLLSVGGLISTYFETPLNPYGRDQPEFYLSCEAPAYFFGKPANICQPGMAATATICPLPPGAPPVFCPPVPTARTGD